MASKLKKPVTRYVEVPLRAAKFRGGFVARITDEGVYLKPPKGRWSNAYLATWGDMLVVAGQRRAEERKAAARARRRARAAGLS
jgi:hypothetical protein